MRTAPPGGFSAAAHERGCKDWPVTPHGRQKGTYSLFTGRSLACPKLPLASTKYNTVGVPETTPR